MTRKQKSAIDWFLFEYKGELPRHKNGDIDFKCLCGEFLVEGVPLLEVMEKYNQLPDELKEHENKKER